MLGNMTAGLNETMGNMTSTLGSLRMGGNTTTNGTAAGMDADMDMPGFDAVNVTAPSNGTQVNSTRAGSNRTAAGGNGTTASSRTRQPKRHFLFF